jgi:serine/threonine protein kinase
LAEKGSLDKLLADDLGRSRLGSFQRRLQVALDVLTAIRFLHEGSKDNAIKACFHRDIKSGNIVLKRDFTAQLIDCGLAKLVSDDASTALSTMVGIKGTLGYLDPEYVSTGEYTAACDIYSFGVVLLELWTGRLQNSVDESGCLFSFRQQYVRRKQKVEDDVDAALDLDDLSPLVSTRFTKLALKCIAEFGNDRPSGGQVFKKLTEILAACSSLEHAALSSTAPESLDSCPTCRTMTVNPHHDECAHCHSRGDHRQLFSLVLSWGETIEEMGTRMRRIEMSTSQTNRRVEDLTRRIEASAETTNRLLLEVGNKIDSMLPILAHLDMRINNQIPRMFILIPADIKSGWKHPESWLRSTVQTKYYLFFVCAASHKVVSPPIKLKVTKEWVCKVAPVLATGLFLLKMSMKVGLNVNLDLDGVATELFEMSSSHIGEMLAEVTKLVNETSNRGLLDRLELQQLSDEDVKELRGDSYEFLLEQAREQYGWRSAMKTVRIPSSSAVMWVAKEVAADPKYEIINT